MNEKTYYSLRLLGSNAFHSKDDVLKTTNQVLNIGETADCEIRFEQVQYEPERYATIVENEDGKSWRLIQRSEYVKAQIAGSGDFGYVHQLKDGDVISFDGQDMELEFHIHHDSNYGALGVVIEQKTNLKLLYFVIGIVAMIAVAFAFFRSGDISYDKIKEYDSSVYLLQVDSVQWIAVAHGDTTLVRPTLNTQGTGAVGTAFLTTDNKLVTARHCIEYWIGEDIDEMPKTRAPDDVRTWAVLAETYMYNKDPENDSIQMLRVYFSVCKPNDREHPVFSFSSTDPCVHINRDHDGFLEFGDYDNVYVWRTVHPTPDAAERELGDIVYIDVDKKGAIALADSATISSLTQSSAVAVLGFPRNLKEIKCKFSSGRIAEDRSDTTGVNPNIQFDANITHGFSGGPLFIRKGNTYFAAGVVSKIDTENGIYKKAVPVTEIDNMISREKERKGGNQ